MKLLVVIIAAISSMVVIYMTLGITWVADKLSQISQPTDTLDRLLAATIGAYYGVHTIR